MTQSILFQPVTVAIDADGDEARLAFVGDRLVAVVTRLQSGAHPSEHRGRWHLEAGFGPCVLPAKSLLFASLDEVAAWIERCLADAPAASLGAAG